MATSCSRAARSRTSAASHGRLGIGRTFQNVALFRRMSVRDNVWSARIISAAPGFIANALRLPVVRQEDAAGVARLNDLLDLLDLREVADSGPAACRSARRSASSWRAR